MRKLTIEFVREQFQKEGYKLLNTEYKGAHQKLDYICDKGHKNTIVWYSFQQGQRCPDCSRLNIEFIREQFKKEGYQLFSTEYIGAHSKLDYICDKGHKNNITWGSFQQGNRCSECSGTKKKTIEFIRKEFEKEEYVLLNDEYKNSKSKLNYICNKGHKNSIQWNSFQSGFRCPECGGTKKKTIEFIREQFEKIGWTFLSNEYQGAHSKLDYICDKGHKNNITWACFQRGNRCSICAEYGFNPDKPAILYYLKLNCGLYKIGITNRTVKERYCVEDYKMFVSICVVHYEKGKDAHDEEQRILKENNEFKYIGPHVLKSGNTELFTKDILI